MRGLRPFLLAFAMTLPLAGCPKPTPLPEDKKEYAGTWKGEGMMLRIDAGGTVEYERKKGNTSTSVNGPIQRYEGDDFVVGALGIETTFDVSVTPHQVDGKWVMTVDGVELTRQ